MIEEGDGQKELIHLVVNGETHEFEVGPRSYQVEPSHTLLYTLRERLGLTGAKVGCDQGACGACTVLIDGKARLSCSTLTIECDGRSITTIEGLADRETGALDPVQQAFVDQTAFQCGFCTPGIIMVSKAFLEENPTPNKEQIEEALSGHFCRCISHYHVIDALQDVVGKGDQNDQ